MPRLHSRKRKNQEIYELKNEPEINPSGKTTTILANNLIEAINFVWKCFRKEVNSLMTTPDLDLETIKNIQARYDLANAQTILDQPCMIKELSFRHLNESYPFCQIPGGADNLMRHKLPQGKYTQINYGHFGQIAGIPFTTRPYSNQYTFKRSFLFDDINYRKFYLENYYEGALQLANCGTENNFELAAKALLPLFSHIIKESLLCRTSHVQIKTFINHELIKCGLKEMDHRVMTHLTLLWELFSSPPPLIHNKFNINPLCKLPILSPVLDDPIIDGVKKVFIEKYCCIVTPNKNISLEIVNQVKLIEGDCDVYDKSTGQFIAGIRRNKIDPADVKNMNLYAFAIEKKLTKRTGASSTNDEKDEKSKRYIPRSLPIGIMGTDNKRNNIKLTNGITYNPYSQELLATLSRILPQAESVYKQIAPEEYQYAKDIAQSIKDLIIFDNVETATVVELNYDKQTNLHRDLNLLPGKRIGYLSTYFGSEKKRYKGCYTMFPEYGIGFDINEGDVLVADFENIHCNSPLEKLDQREFLETSDFGTKDNYVRCSIIAFIRSELAQSNKKHMHAKTQKMIFETSDDEVDFEPADIEAAKIHKPVLKVSKSFNYFFEHAKNPNSEKNIKIAKNLYELRNKF